MSNVELKPCVCGDNCGWQTKVYVSPQGAKNAWNRRADDEYI